MSQNEVENETKIPFTHLLPLLFHVYENLFIYKKDELVS